MSFHLAWVISALAIIVVAGAVGKVTRKSIVGILIDERGRYSLNHLQIVMWTIIALSAISGVFIARLFEPGGLDPLAFAIPQELLILMGISVGSATIAAAAKSAKDASGAKILRTNFGTTATSPKAHFSQVFQQEEGSPSAEPAVDVTKFQNFLFTLLAGLGYVVLVWNQGSIAGLPGLSDNLLVLLGISHAGYVGGKLPRKA